MYILTDHSSIFKMEHSCAALDLVIDRLSDYHVGTFPLLTFWILKFVE